MKILMVGVNKTIPGGMWTVIENYFENDTFCKKTNLIYCSTVTRANVLKKVIYFFKACFQIIFIIKNQRIDIVHVHMAERGSVFRKGIVIWIANKMGVKTIIHMHGATIKEWYVRQNIYVRKIVKKIFSTADSVLVLGHRWTPFVESVVGENNRGKIRVLYNAVKIPKQNLYNNNAKNILFYGVLVPRKGIDDLLQAFNLILPEIPKDIHLVLYGDDSKNNIEAKIAFYGLEGRAEYKGWLDRKNFEQCFSNIMLNILPSYNEGLPMTIIETMSYGIPNISTDIAAIPEVIINGENGNLIEPGNFRQLADSMKTLINDPKLRLQYSEKAYQKILQDFSLDIHLKKLIGIYEELLK